MLRSPAPARPAGLADRFGARFEVAEPAGHLVVLDRPGRMARAVQDAAAQSQGPGATPGPGPE
ncbi:hypothetical protein ABZZ20_11585 [Streptomyces sp. NPDC006430]|uniref:hypothetical protein n=1 Tax=Streptomyces sp. NPDC006430 TaxID=3154299 RepID=UPI0033A6AF39